MVQPPHMAGPQDQDRVVEAEEVTHRVEITEEVEAVVVQELLVVSYLLSQRYGREPSRSEPSVETVAMEERVVQDRQVGRDLPEAEVAEAVVVQAEPQSLSTAQRRGVEAMFSPVGRPEARAVVVDQVQQTVVRELQGRRAQATKFNRMFYIKKLCRSHKDKQH